MTLPCGSSFMVPKEENKVPKDYTAQAVTDIRRKDRAMHDETWIKDFLTHAAFGHLANVHEGQPFIDSNFFV